MDFARSRAVIPTKARIKVLKISTLIFFNTQICTTFAQHLFYLVTLQFGLCSFSVTFSVTLGSVIFRMNSSVLKDGTLYFRSLDVAGSVTACVDRHLLNDALRSSWRIFGVII